MLAPLNLTYHGVSQMDLSALGVGRVRVFLGNRRSMRLYLHYLYDCGLVKLLYCSGRSIKIAEMV